MSTMSAYLDARRCADLANDPNWREASSKPDAGAMAIAELCHWYGKGLVPQAGYGLHQTTLGDAEVWIEYEFQEASGDGWNEPRYEASVTVGGILINGVMCDAQDVAPHKLDDWAAEILAGMAADSAAARCDADDNRAEELALERYERELDAMASQ